MVLPKAHSPVWATSVVLLFTGVAAEDCVLATVDFGTSVASSLLATVVAVDILEVLRD